MATITKTCKNCKKKFLKEHLNKDGRCYGCAIENAEFVNLRDYYNSLFPNRDIKWPMIIKKFKDLCKNMDITNGQIHAILTYMVEIEQINYDEDIENLIPYYFDKTRRYYGDLQRLSQCKVYGILPPIQTRQEQLVTPKPYKDKVDLIDIEDL